LSALLSQHLGTHIRVEELKSKVDKGTIEEIKQSEADIKKLDD